MADGLRDELSPDQREQLERDFMSSVEWPAPHLRAVQNPDFPSFMNLRCDHCAASVSMNVETPPSVMARRGTDFYMRHRGCVAPRVV